MIFPPEYTEVNKGHGRIETRRIQTSTRLNDYVEFPHVGQVFWLKREVTDLKGNALRQEEIVYGLTSLSSEKASAKDLLRLNRGHWSIENSSHYVRDVTFQEDRSRIRKKSGPQVMATLRNLVLSLMRLLGITNIAQALREFAWNSRSTALRLIGIV
jgi:hypothetical protein